MKKNVLLFTLLFVFITFTSYSQWHWQNPYPQGHTLDDITFCNENIGWAVGEFGTILKTINGGENWQCLDNGITMSDINNLSST